MLAYVLVALLTMPPSLSLFLIGMPTGAKQHKSEGESVLFQPVLKAYPT